MSKPPLSDENGEVRELDADDIASFRPIAEIDPEMARAMTALRNKGGRPKSIAPKQQITFRLDAKLIELIKAEGQGYNLHVERVLSKAFGETRPKAARRAKAQPRKRA